jgi:hypothetical protein
LVRRRDVQYDQDKNWLHPNWNAPVYLELTAESDPFLAPGAVVKRHLPLSRFHLFIVCWQILPWGHSGGFMVVSVGED